MAVTQEKKGNTYWTHVDWELEGVTPDMIDWFWANMEKGFFLWHPSQHKAFFWEIAPTQDKFIGAIHCAPQQWKDGRMIKPFLRFDDVSTLKEEIADVIVYDHTVIVTAVRIEGGDLKLPPADPKEPYYNHRIHQWQKTDKGVKGRSSAIGNIPETEERGQIWAAHATEECSNWGVFLPELYKLYRVIENPEVNVPVSLLVKRKGKKLSYVNLK